MLDHKNRLRDLRACAIDLGVKGNVNEYNEHELIVAIRTVLAKKGSEDHEAVR